MEHASPAAATAPTAPSAPALTPSGADTASVDSEALLRGHQAIAISHNGEIQRLQATRLGKLILPK
ncbi:MAG TPA: hemin uptake protein HemP [Burkholderiaceae bacterium]|nr:hemin uptake protein HemP [Burkholderiaceae bacterium]